MNYTACCSDNEYSIHLFRDDKEIVQGDVVMGGEHLIVKVMPAIFHIVLEARGATFEYGKCDSRRTTLNSAVLIIPPDPISPVVIANAWATSFTGGVKLSTPFRLNPQQYINSDSIVNILMVL